MLFSDSAEEFFQLFRYSAHGKTDYVEVIAADCRNEHAGFSLDAVTACFVVGLIGRAVFFDLFGTQCAKMHIGGNCKEGGFICVSITEHDTREYTVTSSGE